MRNSGLVGWVLLVGLLGSTETRAQCPEEPDLQNWTDAGRVACPCFVAGERAGSVLDLPADEFPIEILRIGVGWGSVFGSAPDSLEAAIHVYDSGLPDPGTPIFSLIGPVLTDGVVNEFNVEPLPGEVIINSGPFSVALEFDNANAGDGFAPTTVHDGNGCQAGKNLIFAIPGGWTDACALMLTGDWVFYVVYRPVTCGPAVTVGSISSPLVIDKFFGNLLFTWGSSCTPTDSEYEVYRGIIGGIFESHESIICQTAGGTTTIVPQAPLDESNYYLVVPANSDNEGSYGLRTPTIERITGANQCLPQLEGACPPE